MGDLNYPTVFLRESHIKSHPVYNVFLTLLHDASGRQTLNSNNSTKLKKQKRGDFRVLIGGPGGYF
jgi:hypothetical protein